MAIPIFIVGSGRNGSELAYRLLREYANVHSHHEYQIHRIQPLACKHAMRLADLDYVFEQITEIYGSALSYEKRDIWVNSCNKAGWFIPELLHLFPNAKFVHLIRDGRSSVSSYYHKLEDECYSNTEDLIGWLEGKTDTEPPWEKKYWWPVPLDRNSYSRFELICWFWNKLTHQIRYDFSEFVLDKQQLTIKLEDFVKNWETFSEFFNFCGVEPRRDLFNMAQTPVNTREQISYPLTPEENAIFWRICGKTMRELGYREEDAYLVKNYAEEGNRSRGELRYSY